MLEVMIIIEFNILANKDMIINDKLTHIKMIPQSMIINIMIQNNSSIIIININNNYKNKLPNNFNNHSNICHLNQSLLNYNYSNNIILMTLPS